MQQIELPLSSIEELRKLRRNLVGSTDYARVTCILMYSPNLNLIECLWKFIRKKVINAGFYRTKEEFRRAIMRFFDNLGIFREELASLLTPYFRLANSQSISF